MGQPTERPESPFFIIAYTSIINSIFFSHWELLVTIISTVEAPDESEKITLRTYKKQITNDFWYTAHQNAFYKQDLTTVYTPNDTTFDKTTIVECTLSLDHAKLLFRKREFEYRITSFNSLYFLTMSRRSELLFERGIKCKKNTKQTMVCITCNVNVLLFLL